jgi:SPP1 family predicted phage head-tail adaptor
VGFDALLNKTCTIERRVASQDATTGQETMAWVTIASGVPCCINTFGGGEKNSSNQKVVDATNKIYFRPGSTYNEKDRITLDGKQYDILLVADASGRTHHMETWVQLVKTEDAKY